MEGGFGRRFPLSRETSKGLENPGSPDASNCLATASGTELRCRAPQDREIRRRHFVTYSPQPTSSSRGSSHPVRACSPSRGRSRPGTPRPARLPLPKGRHGRQLTYRPSRVGNPFNRPDPERLGNLLRRSGTRTGSRRVCVAGLDWMWRSPQPMPAPGRLVSVAVVRWQRERAPARRRLWAPRFPLRGVG